jgi:hypothetical protein
VKIMQAGIHPRKAIFLFALILAFLPFKASAQIAAQSPGKRNLLGQIQTDAGSIKNANQFPKPSLSGIHSASPQGCEAGPTLSETVLQPNEINHPELRTLQAVREKTGIFQKLNTGLPPTVYNIFPDAGFQGTTMAASIYGTKLLDATSVTFGGTGVTATIDSGTASNLYITITLAADTPVGDRDVTVTTPNGSSSLSGAFTVLMPALPVIKNIYVGSATPGASPLVRVSGLNMLGVSAVNFSGTGVSATIIPVDFGEFFMQVTVASDAPLGIRNVTVTNIAGTSAVFTGFTVANQTTMPVTWKLRSEQVDFRTGHDINGLSANLIGSKIYASHGYRNECRSGISSMLSIYDIPTNTWTHGGASAPSATIARSETAGGTAFGKHYAMGGLTEYGTAATSAVEMFDPLTGAWSTRTSMSVARAGLGAASLDNKIYTIGGSTGTFRPESGIILDSNEVYDPQSNTWTTLAPLPTPVMGNSATIAYNGKIFVFGGLSPTGTSNQTQIYNVDTNTWTTGAPLSTARFNAMAGLLNGQIVIFGGLYIANYSKNGQAGGYSSSDRTEIYDPTSDTWTIGPDMKLLNGQGSQGVTYNDTQIYAVGSCSGFMQVLDASTNPQPTITSFSVTSGAPGSSISAVINGTNLSGATSIVFIGTGVTATIQPGGTSTSIPVIISIDPTATPGPQQFSVNTATGSSGLSGSFIVIAGKHKSGQITSY